MYNRQNHTDQDLSTPSRQNFVPTKGILDCVLYVRINPVDLVNGWGLLVCFQNKLVQTLCKLLCRPWPWSMSDTAAAVVTCPCYVTAQLIVRGNSPALCLLVRRSAQAVSQSVTSAQVTERASRFKSSGAVTYQAEQIISKYKTKRGQYWSPGLLHPVRWWSLY